jgi:GtrA-like protein
LVASNVLAWLVAVSGSYVMNTTITFRAESGRVLRGTDYLRFVVSGVLGAVATTTLMVLSAKLIPSQPASFSISRCRISQRSVRAHCKTKNGAPDQYYADLRKSEQKQCVWVPAGAFLP